MKSKLPVVRRNSVILLSPSLHEGESHADQPNMGRRWSMDSAGGPSSTLDDIVKGARRRDSVDAFRRESLAATHKDSVEPGAGRGALAPAHGVSDGSAEDSGPSRPRGLELVPVSQHVWALCGVW